MASSGPSAPWTAANPSHSISAPVGITFLVSDPSSKGLGRCARQFSHTSSARRFRVSESSSVAPAPNGRPPWAKHAVSYQISPDRSARSELAAIVS